ncbi:AraC family transcriptional regulator [Actinoplanes sp. NEAU-A12]|uniref:AraC family transcriptional regulator n=1 Tax=Actinoplanes sandaracinus TaxID=3045177 RepID=A0ABT6WGJ3_9ACTN|nr:AraC family transcriptional regulator [Actinoplanes sandaracinus]MDI6098844.1 AraC family transcriptional regulator [Actinoplanes sandaracinus]
MEIRDRIPGTRKPIGRTDRSGVLHPENLARYAATTYPASAAISEVVDHFWTVAWNLPGGERIDQRILTDPAVTLTVEAGHVPAELVVTGVHRRAWTREIAGWGAGFAIRLRPAGLAVVSDLTPEAVADRTLAVGPALDARLYALLRAVAAAPDTATRIARATEIISEMTAERPLTGRQRLANETVDAINRGDPLPAGRSARTVQRALRETIGHGPAWVRRWVRLQEAARQFAVDGASGAADIATRLGYTDQAHLVNEFRAAVGRTPGEYVRALHRTARSTTP